MLTYSCTLECLFFFPIKITFIRNTVCLSDIMVAIVYGLFIQ